MEEREQENCCADEMRKRLEKAQAENEEMRAIISHLQKINSLKPCPFCGGKAELTFSGSTYTNETQKGYIIVKCLVCGGAGKGVYYYGDVIAVSYTHLTLPTNARG